MIRGLLIVVVLATAAVGGVALAADGGGDDGTARYTVILDNAFGLIEGADLKAAGVKVGKIQSLDIEPRTNRAAVGVVVEDQSFGSFRKDVFCSVEPQSLIGEYFLDCEPGTDEERLEPGATIPVEQTAITIPPDLVNNVLRRPERERFALIFAELGAGFAARDDDVQATIQRAIPALRETDKVLEILADSRETITQLNVDADAVLSELAANRDDVARFVAEARDTSVATAERRQDLETTINRLPAFLRELRPTLRALGDAADEQTPALRDLRASAGQLETLFRRLQPFTEAADPAIESLGEAALIGREAAQAAGGTVSRLGELGGMLGDPAGNLAIILEHLLDRDFAVEDNPVSPGGEGFTGVEAFLQYVFRQANAINLFDSRGYFLKLNALINECGAYTNNKTRREEPERTETCSNPLNKEPLDESKFYPIDEGPEPPAPSRAKARSKDEKKAEAPAAAPQAEARPAPAPAPEKKLELPKVQETPETVEKLLDSLLPGQTKKLVDRLAGRDGQPRGGAGGAPSPRTTQALLDFLLSP